LFFVGSAAASASDDDDDDDVDNGEEGTADVAAAAAPVSVSSVCLFCWLVRRPHHHPLHTSKLANRESFTLLSLLLQLHLLFFTVVVIVVVRVCLLFCLPVSLVCMAPSAHLSWQTYRDIYLAAAAVP